MPILPDLITPITTSFGICLGMLNVRSIPPSFKTFSAILAVTLTSYVFRRIRKTAKGEYYLRHVCLSTPNYLVPTARIFVKFYT